jgi:hypothetical protein
VADGSEAYFIALVLDNLPAFPDDRPCNASAMLEIGIGRVDDRIRVPFGDITLNRRIFLLPTLCSPMTFTFPPLLRELQRNPFFSLPLSNYMVKYS